MPLVIGLKKTKCLTSDSLLEVPSQLAILDPLTLLLRRVFLVSPLERVTAFAIEP